MAKFVSNRPVRVYKNMQLNADDSKGIGIFGGTFDPVHIGHLRASVELRKTLGLSEMRLIPSANPPHKAQPETNAEHRLAMLQLALANEPGLVADARELHRKGLSYTLDTLTEIRAEIGVETPLCLCIGMDSLIDLNQWHRWRELTDVAHVGSGGKARMAPATEWRSTGICSGTSRIGRRTTPGSACRQYIN